MTDAEWFRQYLTETKMTFSYKAVVVLALLSQIDSTGECSRAALISTFHEFYMDRLARGLEPERERDLNPSPLIHPEDVTPEQVWQILYRYPLELLKDFILVSGETVAIRPSLWTKLSASDLIALKEIAQQRLDAYYDF